MSHYTRTPRMVTPRLVPQPTPVVYAPVNTPTPYYNHELGRRQSLGPHYPGQQIYHVPASEPSHSRGHHRSSSKSRKHRRSHSTDRHGGRHHHHRRSSTPNHSVPVRYSPETQYATIPSSRHRRHSYSVPDNHYRSSSRDPHRAVPYNYREYNYHRVTHRGESIGERIKRFFGFGTHKVRFVDPSGHQVDRLGRPIYAM
ncbi:hypothetical protein BDM02DRAFT_3184282 [Thelephora ganbajun]|uniref:Uncharacterized protein n=1 Tax=Thelephora ganbajun TaxID=370292 RepID=A0ACB6ZPT9_THEGA|nr:hypothetical protein BDM02DRAFT_3184282 [Thelephora ganbajun]